MSIQCISAFRTAKRNIKCDYRKVKFSEPEKSCLEQYKSIADYSSTKPLLWGAKRAVDIVSGAVGLVLSAPILLLSALAIKLDSKGPVIFKQKRIGKDGKPFDVYKLRTMYSDMPENLENVKSADDKRITRVGRFLRKFSIDEYPQFYNILKGEMSLIGPRPIPPYEHAKAKDFPEFAGRYAVKPGAKLEYDKATMDDPRKRFEIEKNYILNWSPAKDIKVLARVVRDVVTGKNY
ncbi:MAG: sugar transferase [Cyanobacteria bacterium RUI128]|nr:sugar transferase [Cyanobacteria bacterium RUI128]